MDPEPAETASSTEDAPATEGGRRKASGRRAAGTTTTSPTAEVHVPRRRSPQTDTLETPAAPARSSRSQRAAAAEGIAVEPLATPTLEIPGAESPTTDPQAADTLDTESLTTESLTTDSFGSASSEDAVDAAPRYETGRFRVDAATEERPESGAELRTETWPVSPTAPRSGGAGYQDTWSEPRIDPRHGPGPDQRQAPGPDRRHGPGPDLRHGPGPDVRHGPGPDTRQGPGMRQGRQPGLDDTTPWRPNGPMDPTMRPRPEQRVAHVYRSRRPAMAVLLIILALGFGALFFQALARSASPSHYSTAGLIASAFALASIPALGIGLYGLVTGAAHGAEQFGFRLWARPPLAYLVIGLVLAVAAGAAAGAAAV